MGSGPNCCNQSESWKLCRSCKENSLFPLDLKLWGCEPGINKTHEGKAELWNEAKTEQNWQTERIWILSRSLESNSSVQSLSCVQLFATSWTAGHQASLSITNSQGRPKPMSIESVMPSNHLILCCPLLLFSSCPQSFPASGSFPMSQLFPSGGQSIGVSASTSVLPVNTQDWSPLGWTGWISSQSKRLSRVFSSTTVQISQSSHA